MGTGRAEEYGELRKTLRDLLETELPISKLVAMDRDQTFPLEILAKLADFGAWGVHVPEEYGGAPLDELGACIVVEEIARTGGDNLIFAWMPTATFCARAIAKFATQEQKQTWLPGIARGVLRFAMGLSEPDHGSDLMHLTTRAVKTTNGYRVSGQKIFTTGAQHANYLLTLARTNPDVPAHRGLSFLVIPSEQPGVTRRPLDTLAGHAVHTCEVFLDDVDVPESSILGTPGGGADLVRELLDVARLEVAAQALGIAQGAYDLALRYACDRQQFGKPIIEHQAVGHLIADMAIDVELVRSLLYSTAQLVTDGKPCSLEASMVKIAASEAATRCAGRGMQVLGGYSYMVEYGMERFFRESKLTEIVDGTNQIQRNIIARALAHRGR